MKQLNSINKPDWQQGAFQEEPDKAQWTSRATGLDCLIVRNNSGALCGYVGIPSDHPYFELNHKHDWVKGLDVQRKMTFTDLIVKKSRILK